MEGQPVDSRTGAPLNEAGGRRNWEMRWDPVAEKWVAQNRGAGWGEMGRPIDDPNPVRFDDRAGEHYDSGDAHRPGEANPHTPPETYERGSAEPGVDYRARAGDVDTPWRRYQEQISGWEATPDGRVPEYTMPDVLDPSRTVTFDGHVLRGEPPQEVFLEAKRGYEILDRSPDTPRARGIRQNLEEEVIRQYNVLPDNARLEWHVSTESGATAIRNAVINALREEGMDVDRIVIIATDST